MYDSSKAMLIDYQNKTVKVTAMQCRVNKCFSIEFSQYQAAMTSVPENNWSKLFIFVVLFFLPASVLKEKKEKEKKLWCHVYRIMQEKRVSVHRYVRKWKELNPIANERDVCLNTSSLTRVSRPFMSLSIFLFPVFGSTPSCPVLYLPCSCSDREIHTWRTLSVGYCMFISKHECINSVPHCDSHLGCFWHLAVFQTHLMTRATPGKWMWYSQYGYSYRVKFEKHFVAFKWFISCNRQRKFIFRKCWQNRTL